MLAGLIDWKISEEFIAMAVFYSIAAVTIISAILVVTLRNIFHCAIMLAVTLISIACLYLFMNSEFLAIMQILLYVGGILTVILFAIMLISKISENTVRQTNEQKLTAFILSASLFVLLLIAVFKLSPGLYDSGAVISFKEIGTAVLTEYAFPFEFMSIVLLAALIGSIAMAYRKKEKE